MATIIPFHPSYEEDVIQPRYVEHLVEAAWQFSRCALWPAHDFKKPEVEATKDYIRDYFTAATHKRRAFTALCQRVILVQKYLRKSSARYVPMPSVWFNRQYPFGFAGTLAWLQRVEEQRRKVSGYLAHVEALAYGYFDFAMKPTGKQFDKCREKLLRYHASTLLELFNVVTEHKYCQRA